MSICVDLEAARIGTRWPCIRKRTRDARSFGELPSFPTKEDARARASTLPHRAHLATVLGPDTGEADEPPPRVPPPPHPRQGGLRESWCKSWIAATTLGPPASGY